MSNALEKSMGVARTSFDGAVTDQCRFSLNGGISTSSLKANAAYCAAAYFLAVISQDYLMAWYKGQAGSKSIAQYCDGNLWSVGKYGLATHQASR